VRVKELKDIPDKETTGGEATVMLQTTRATSSSSPISKTIVRALPRARRRGKRGGPPR